MSVGYTPVSRFPVTGYGTSAVLGATTAIECQVADSQKKVRLLRVKVKRTAGTAANFTPRIFSASGVSTAGAIQQEYAGASTAVADLFDPQIPDNVVFWTDTSGKFYLIPGPDAGADNVFQYEVRYEILA
jgi:hypothetical protein